VAVSFGKKGKAVKVSNLPLAEDVRIRVSFELPGSVNNVSFDWERLKGLTGKKVSVMLVADAGGLVIDSFATAND
jgi:hypothetical protein